MGLKPSADRNRAIFAEVSDAPRAPLAPGAIDRAHFTARPAIRAWLLTLVVLVVVLITVGGLTRLTDSGLSITEWEPISGTIPPLSAGAWAAEFDAYRQIPQYDLINRDMTLSEFKSIYWWEWAHRMLGRVVGLVWAAGFAWFWLRRQIPTGWSWPMLGLGALIGVQGAVGWWMVHSGLQTGMISVASYRLATHLGIAFVIVGLAWTWSLHFARREADLLQARRAAERPLRRIATWLLGLTMLQVVLGALVAGIDAGRAFPTWPLMAGGVFPPDPFGLTPLWRNFFEDAGLVQFMHRTTGYIVFAVAIAAFLRARRSPNGRTRAAWHGVVGLMTLQIAIGIGAVLMQAPLWVAILHQFTAILLWLALLRARFLARYPAVQSVRGAT